MVSGRTYLHEIRRSNESHECLDQIQQGFLMSIGCVSDLGRSFEDAHHAWPILSQEHSGLLFNLFVVNSPRKNSIHNDPQNREKQIVVPLKSIGVFNV